MKKKGDVRGLPSHRVREEVSNYLLSLALAKGNHAWAERLRSLPIFRVAHYGREAIRK